MPLKIDSKKHDFYLIEPYSSLNKIWMNAQRNAIFGENFATLRPDISKTGGHTKKIIFTQNLLKVDRNALEPKKIQILFFTTRHKILPFGKKLP